MFITIHVDWSCLKRSIIPDNEIFWDTLNFLEDQFKRDDPINVLTNAISELNSIETEEVSLYIETHVLWRLNTMRIWLQHLGINVSPGELLERGMIAYMRDKSWSQD